MDRTEAFVPYLGAHLAELIGIYDGNADTLPEAPHMMNMYKKILVARSLALLSRMQRLSYNIEPIRMLGAIINRSFKPNIRYMSKEGIETNRALYDRSLQLEATSSTLPRADRYGSGTGVSPPASPMRPSGNTSSNSSSNTNSNSSSSSVPIEQLSRQPSGRPSATQKVT